MGLVFFSTWFLIFDNFEPSAEKYSRSRNGKDLKFGKSDHFYFIFFGIFFKKIVLHELKSRLKSCFLAQNLLCALKKYVPCSNLKNLVIAACGLWFNGEFGFDILIDWYKNSRVFYRPDFLIPIFHFYRHFF